MAITVAMRTEVSQLYVALFGRAPDSEGLGFWVNLRNQGQSLTQIANSMFATAPARDFFPTWMTNQEIISSFYQNVLGRAPGNDPEGIAFWTAKLNATGATPGSVITQMIQVVANFTGTNPDGVLSAALFNNKVAVAQHFAESGGNIANSTIVLDGVTFDTNTRDAAIAAIDAGTIGVVPDTPQTLTLTTGVDGMSGGSANDTFVANVVQNQLGEQVNTLGSGDSLNGGAGTDTLMAKVTAGAFVGSGPFSGTASMPIQPMTSGIEVVKLEAVNSNVGVDPFSGMRTTTVYVNAKDMLGVNTIGSWHSDANLVIQNMTTQDNGGVGRELSEMTVLMGYTGNSDSHWDESDLSVYFDQDYLNPSTSFTKPSVDIRLMNEDKYDIDFAAGLRGNAIEALAGVYIEKLVITLGGGGLPTRSYSLAPFIGELGGPNSNPKTDFIKTYPQLLAAVQAAVVALKAANPTDAALQTLQAVDGGVFLADISPVSGLRREGDSVTLSIDGATNGVPNTLIVAAQDLVLDPIATTPIPNSNRFERADVTPAVPSTELSINIELEKAGLAGDGGELIVGSMFKDGQNEWNDLYDGKGIAVFDVTVSGGGDKPSSLSGLHSTGNNLREVTVTTNAAQTVTFADLRIGNSNTSGLDFERVAEIGDVITPTSSNQNALKDVRVFDASKFKGDLTLFAALTDEVTDKYMNVMDQAPDLPAADNVTFTYTGGSGNDYINLWLSEANFDDAGTTTREDFVLTIDGGAGNDEIVTMIGDGSGEDSIPDNWYLNSKINANMTINGGDGNDTVRTLGAGDIIINGNAGNDTIYSDNTGRTGSSFNDGRAVWVFNAVSPAGAPTNLLSQAAATVSGVNATLTVTFRGLTKTVNIGTSAGALANVAISDLTVNQAIKLAINSDPTLSELLVAEDGPARTLIVRSQIDGVVVASGDLAVTFGSTPLAGGQITIGGLTVFTPTTALTDGYTTGAVRVLNGAESNSLSDNTITGGTGNDVIVLGTTGFLDSGLPANGSNETVVYNAAFGNDVIVNFDSSIFPGSTTFSGAAAFTEVVRLTFSASDGSPAAQQILFDTATVNLSAPATQGVIPALDVATQFVTQYNTFAGTNGWVATKGLGAGDVILTRDTAGAVTDLTSAAFTGSYFDAAATGGGGSVGIAVTTQGADAIILGTASTFTVDFDAPGTAADAAESFTFDGTTVAYAEGDGSVTLAVKLAAATYANWTAVRTGDAVTFTAKAPGATAIGVAADFDLGTNVIVGTVVGVVGAANVGTPIVTVIPAGPGEGVDFLDFRGIGGDLDGTNFQSLVLDKSIVVAAETTANDTAAEVAALFTDSATAMTHVYVAWDANNVGDVWAVSDPAGTGARTATLMGTIDLADTSWGSLTAVNFL